MMSHHELLQESQPVIIINKKLFSLSFARIKNKIKIRLLMPVYLIQVMKKYKQNERFR